ncbi:MAG: ADP-heptose synthase / D-glycero-beta-D-manno-heptose 7-phosphate kinase, partial [uncultured Ramlibacter sp.]
VRAGCACVSRQDRAAHGRGTPRQVPARPRRLHQRRLRRPAPRARHLPGAGPHTGRQPGGGHQHRCVGAPAGQGARPAPEQRAGPRGHACRAAGRGRRDLVRRGHPGPAAGRNPPRHLRQGRRLRHGVAARDGAGAGLGRPLGGRPVRGRLFHDGPGPAHQRL